MAHPTQEAVREAIATVVDPCSRFNGTNLALTSLGMVKAVEVVGQQVRVTLLLDSPFCEFLYEIDRKIRDAVQRELGVGDVVVELCADELWDESRVLPDARQRLEERRALARERIRARHAVRLREQSTETGEIGQRQRESSGSGEPGHPLVS